MRVLFALVLLLGCTPTALPVRLPPTHNLEAANGTSLTVTRFSHTW